VDYRWYHRASPALLAAYYRVTDRIAGFSFERLRQNLTLANSNWTARRIEQLLGVTARTVYPPVVDPVDRPAWSERRNAFLAVGRISPEKEYERSMRILARVRERAPDLTFTIVGTWDRHLSRYMRELRRLAASLGSWVEFRQDVSRDDVRRLMASYRYGIHGMREEHFGMAPAEMARAGMIVWVPRGGGQVEIVGDEPALLYDTEEEGVEKILAVVQAAAEQARVREYLHARDMLFGTDRFIDEVRSIVSAFRE
jgi:glycosyltransferase involved in cell wall biosynthesis